jgi:hypothetical protein
MRLRSPAVGLLATLGVAAPGQCRALLGTRSSKSPFSARSSLLLADPRAQLGVKHCRFCRLSCSTVAPPKPPKVRRCGGRINPLVILHLISQWPPSSNPKFPFLAQTSTRTGGGGDSGDGLRPLTIQQVSEAVSSFRKRSASEEDQLALLDKMVEWASGMSERRLGTKRMSLGLYQGGKLVCMSGAEVRWGRGPPNQDVRLAVAFLIPEPSGNRRVLGFEMMDALKDMAKHNALLLDTAALQEDAASRIFVLENSLGMEADPEAMNPLIRKLDSSMRRTSFVLDDVQSDIGPFWHAFTLDEKDITFFFRRRFSSMREFEVSWTRPQAGNSNGYGTVNGCRVIDVTLEGQLGQGNVQAQAVDVGCKLAEKMRCEVERALVE